MTSLGTRLIRVWGTARDGLGPLHLQRVVDPVAVQVEELSRPGCALTARASAPEPCLAGVLGVDSSVKVNSVPASFVERLCVTPFGLRSEPPIPASS